MSVYVVFNSKTGQIIETHTLMDDIPNAKEHLLATVEYQEKSDLDVAIVDVQSIRAETNYKIDPDTRKLVASESDTGPGFGLMSFVPMGKPTFPQSFKIVYKSDANGPTTVE